MEIQLHSENDDDDLFQLMKVRMSTEQEQIFMISHYLYLQHGADSTQFVVDFDNVWKNVEYTTRGNAKRLLVKHFTDHIDYKIVLFSKEELLQKNIAYQSGEAAYQSGGADFGGQTNGKKIGGAGQNKETILLTVDCFKNFCIIAATPKAKEIRSYYVKMENIMHEYYKNFKNKNNELQNSLQLSQIETSVKRHEVLIESNKNKWVVYFCKIQLYNDGSFILKIGETADIKKRIDALRCDFGTNIILLDVFVCENSIKFEKSLHNNSEIIKYKYNHLEHKNKKMSTEAYHIPNQKEYEKIVKIAISEMYKYNNIELTHLRIEEKKIDLDASRVDLVASLIPLCKTYENMMNILNKITSPLRAVQIDVHSNDSTRVEHNYKQIENVVIENDYHQEPAAYVEETTDAGAALENTITANATGPIVQIYHKNDLTKVVKVYNSITEATRDFNYNNKTASFSAIKKAYQHKTIYLDYRWHFITNRQELDLQKPRVIGETVITHERNQGQVAMLNVDKTKIIKVFKLAKDAANEILQHPSAMCTAIKHSSPLSDHYWMRWENVDVSIQNDFLQSNILPIKQKNVRGTKIKLLHPITNEIVKLFASYTDIQKELKISVKKIKDLIESNEIYQGKYKFKLV